jgi:ATP-binding protein involved in chromosome partitioning
MRIAIPMADGRLAQHFGHCEEFALVDVDGGSPAKLSITVAPAPPHEPGRLPAMLKELGVQTVIAGGIGSRAMALFAESGIQVIAGAPALDAEAVARCFLEGSLVTGDNACSH